MKLLVTSHPCTAAWSVLLLGVALVGGGPGCGGPGRGGDDEAVNTPASGDSPTVAHPAPAEGAPGAADAAATPTVPPPVQPPPEGAAVGAGSPDGPPAEVEPSDKPPVPAEDAALAEALEEPDFTGSFVIEASEASSGTADTCTGDAAMVRRDELLEGIATCTFAGAMADFGTTKGRISLAGDDGPAHFDASPSPVVANPRVSREGGGIQLRFGDTLDLGDGHRITYTARIDLTPVPADGDGSTADGSTGGPSTAEAPGSGASSE